MTRKNEKGQSLVEFALVVPLLILLVFGIAEFGRAWMTQNILTSAAREAVRAVVVYPGDEAAATTRGQALLIPAGITTATFTTPYPTTIELDGTVTRTASVTYNFPFIVWRIFPGLGSGSLTLSGTAKMRREYTP